MGSVEGGARNLSLEMVCDGRRSFLTLVGSGDRVNRIGIWVSTRDLSEVGWTVRTGCVEFVESF